MIRRLDKTMTEIAIEIQNRTSQLHLERASSEQIYRQLRNEAESLLLAVVNEEFGEIYEDDPQWKAVVDTQVVADAVDGTRGQLLRVLMTWSALGVAIEHLQRGTSYLSRSWNGVHPVEDVGPLITDFKHTYSNIPELRNFVSLDELRSVGLLHSRYDEFKLHVYPEA